MRLIAQLVDDDVVDQMVPFVTENIQSQNWRQRESAVMAFGAVLEVCYSTNCSFSASALGDKRSFLRDAHAGGGQDVPPDRRRVETSKP